MMNKSIALTLILSLSPSLLFAQEDGSDAQEARMRSGTFSGLTLRSIGPALMSGRIADIAVDPTQPNTWYVAAGSGGLWKTTNAGTKWTPIFDNYDVYSIGCVTVDPQTPTTIWVGTGEAVGGRHVGFGDGVYRSRDGGKTFQNRGLSKTEHIAKILVDPRSQDVVYVAAQGPLWSPGGERGLYKTTDGGESWDLILSKGPYTGVTEIVCDPRNPDVLFAATHQRHRTVASLINGGPESGIYKSEDGGANWRPLTNGLPGGDKGKIALAISSQQPDVMYATIELPGRTGGFWRSEDAGESWTKMSDYASGGTGPHYYQEIWVDPHRFDVVYHADVQLGRTEDGGRTWKTVESPAKHVDNHAVAFHPADRDVLIVGCDGGVYRSYDYAETYQYCANLPLTQFYKLSLDNDAPFYHIVGGTQDNATQYGPSRTRDASGIRNSDWRITIGGDGHDCAIDPTEPNTIYCESQEGYLRRYDRRTGSAIDIRPQPGPEDEPLRFNWDSPILISPHSSARLYFGSQHLHRSDDRGDSWQTISPDLSRGLDRFLLKVMERVWSIDATWDLFAMSQFGTITSIAESPLQEGLIYVGTDDGLIQVTEDHGQNWRRIDRIYGIPEYAFVNDIKADLHDVNTVYAALDHHKEGDYRPYLIKSTDRGQSWTSIAGDLPDRHLVWRIIQDHVEPNLLFLGTEFGVFFTVDGGQHWIKLTGDVPTIPFRDLEIQRRENDLVGATFGRGFYILDDYTPLRGISEERLDEPFCLFPVKTALQYRPTRILGGEKGSQGDAYFTAPNPPFGAVFTYYLRDSLKTRQQLRREKEDKAKQAGGDNPYPGFDELKKEEREESPQIVLTIEDESGQVIDRVTGPTGSGFHRVAWDLRYAPLSSERGNGPPVLPGRYRVSAAQRVDAVTTPLGEPQMFEVVSIEEPTLPPPDPAEVLAFQKQAGELLRVVNAASGRLQEALEEVQEMKEAIRLAPQVDVALQDEVRQLELKLLDLQERLSGDEIRAGRSQVVLPSIRERAGLAYRGSLTSYGPTQTQRQAYHFAADALQQWKQDFEPLRDQNLRELKQKLDAAGVPWTSGREIPAVP